MGGYDGTVQPAMRVNTTGAANVAIGSGSLAEDFASSLPNHSAPPTVIASTQVTLTRRGTLSGYDTFLGEEVF